LLKLEVELREKPISINAAYSTSRGRRFLTSEGKAFTARLSSVIAKATLTANASWKDVVDTVYKNGGGIHLMIDLYLDDLHNPHWVVGGNKTASGAPRPPYKVFDGSNYIKLIEDAVVKGTGIDDSCHLFTGIEKHHDPDDPRIGIVYTVLE
jgi:hypothetical protein